MTNKISRPGSRRFPFRISLLCVALSAGLAVGLLGGASSSAQVVTAHAASATKFKSKTSLSNIKSGKPTLTVTVSDKVKGGRKITKVEITVPKGFSFSKKHLAHNVSVPGKRFTDGIYKRSLTVVPAHASEALTIKTKKGLITETKKARSAKKAKLTLKVFELGASSSSAGGGGTTTVTTTTTTTTGTGTTTTGNPATDLQDTLTELIANLEGLPSSSDPLSSLVGALGQTVAGVGTTVTDLGDSLGGLGTGGGGSAAEADVEAAATDLQAALTDLSTGNTSGAQAELEAAGTELADAAQAAGSGFPGASQAAELAAALEALAMELGGSGGTGTGTTSTSSTNPATEIQTTLTDIVTGLPGDLSSGNPLSGLTGALGELVTGLGITVADIGPYLESLGGTSGPSEADLTQAASDLQLALTDLGSGDSSGAEAALENAAAEFSAALGAAGGSFPGTSEINALVAELGDLADFLPSGF